MKNKVRAHRIFFALGLALLSLSVSGRELGLESFFECSALAGDRSAKIFVDPQIFCSNERSHPATLLAEDERGQVLYNGRLWRWRSGKGESFVYSKNTPEGRFEVTLVAPYKEGAPRLVYRYDSGPAEVFELQCRVKQIHAECD